MLPWIPQNPFIYSGAYPKTPPLPSQFDPKIQETFVELWNTFKADSPELERWRGIELILVRGLFGPWMPGHFSKLKKLLLQKGFLVSIAPTLAAGTVSENADRLESFLMSTQFSGKNFVFLAHSKGGLDTLSTLKKNTTLRGRTLGCILVQTPRGPSAVLESMFSKKHQNSLSLSGRLKERIGAGMLRTLRQDRGCLDMTEERLEFVIKNLDSIKFEFRILSVSSWSTQPTNWLDSFHKRLGEIRPGVAHDGQFFLNDLIWPATQSLQHKNLLLREVDHAQPVVGGFGFDYARLWHSLLRLL